jgi:hypothetical protein
MERGWANTDPINLKPLIALASLLDKSQDSDAEFTGNAMKAIRLVLDSQNVLKR